jgi:REP element-mobilizing transposase RayT
MPVYHFTLHAYRSWTPAHRRGYVRRGKGILPTDMEMARVYAGAAKHPPVIFTTRIQKMLIDVSLTECAAQHWRLHAVATDKTHIHLLISWKTSVPWNDVVKRLKNILSYRIGREQTLTGRRWFVRGQSRRRVIDRAHFEYLVQKYFPDHNGVGWTEPTPAAQIC